MLFHRLAAALKNNQGNTVIIFGLTFLIVMCAIGGAVDFSLVTVKKNATRDALDEAVLSAAISSLQNEKDLEALANKVFKTNIDEGKIDAELVSFKYDATTRAVSATATGAYNTFIIRLLNPNFDRLGYTVTSNSIRASDGTLEVALVLDNTWSMNEPLDGSQTKLAVLKTAAKSLIASIMTPANKDYVKVSVVPYAQHINVGTGNRGQTWMSVPNDTTTVSNNPAKCTTISTKQVCTGGTWGTCTRYTDGIPETYGCWTKAQTCTTVAITPYESCTKATTTTTTNKWYGCIYNQMVKVNSQYALVMPDPTTAYKGYIEQTSTCLVPIQPLTNDSSKITSVIDSLFVTKVTSNTYTPGGLIWGVNVLSPPAPFKEGAAYDTKNKIPRKTIVLMTDGANTGYTTNSGSVATGTTAQVAVTYADQKRVCDYARAKNIEIYTIGFGVKDATALSYLQSCATDNAHYFDAKSSADLIAAFKTIGGQLTKVRLTS
ncbi:hypothetical protein MMA231_02771 [Asticcacaulis sp. MM231]|uniref:vWA domain-containing protein n=1 Tax=Asticcacaulis sp. MM231 TaxID=3157666 RepID=UPI0032D589F0